MLVIQYHASLGFQFSYRFCHKLLKCRYAGEKRPRMEFQTFIKNSVLSDEEVISMRKARRLLQNKGYRANKLRGGGGFSFDSDTSALFGAAHQVTNGAQNASQWGKHSHNSGSAAHHQLTGSVADADVASAYGLTEPVRTGSSAPSFCADGSRQRGGFLPGGRATVTLHREPVGPPPLETEPVVVQPSELSNPPLVYAVRRENSIAGQWEARFLTDPDAVMVANLPAAAAEQTPAALVDLLGFTRITRNIYHGNVLSSPKRAGKEGAGGLPDDYVCECVPSADGTGVPCGPDSDCTVLVFGQEFALEDAIRSHDC
jgi:hypothetical protein